MEGSKFKFYFFLVEFCFCSYEGWYFLFFICGDDFIEVFDERIDLINLLIFYREKESKLRLGMD